MDKDNDRLIQSFDPERGDDGFEGDEQSHRAGMADMKAFGLSKYLTEESSEHASLPRTLHRKTATVTTPSTDGKSDLE